jgi:hypothetical protein
MAEIRTVTTLRRKRDEIAASVRLYERQLEQAKADLALFRRGETWAICREALAAKGAMTTKELVDELMKARKLPTGDRILNRALGMKLVNALGNIAMSACLLGEQPASDHEAADNDEDWPP